jgi:hypothetical protein
MSSEVNAKLTDTYNEVILNSMVNRTTDEKSNLYKGDSRLKSMFTLDRQGIKAPYSELMKSFRPGSLLNKKGVEIERKKLPDTEALRIT